MDSRVKFRVAMALYAVIGVAEWLTLDGRVRETAWLLLGMFVVMSVLRHARRRVEEKADGSGA